MDPPPDSDSISAARAAENARAIAQKHEGVDFQPDRLWLNFFNVAMGRMSWVGKKRFELERVMLREEEINKRCEGWRDEHLQSSPIVRFLRDNINQLGADINASNVFCRRCDNEGNGWFDPHYGIMLCANKLTFKSDQEDAMAHEMVHAYDHVRFQVDWMNLKHMACTEIRASTLSGECRFYRNYVTRGAGPFTMGFQNCVRKFAVNSVMSHGKCKDRAQAQNAVDSVWESCFNDTRPFDEIYK